MLGYHRTAAGSPHFLVDDTGGTALEISRGSSGATCNVFLVGTLLG